MLLGAVDPWLLAGLLYLGSGLGLLAAQAGRRLLGIERPEAPLRRTDLPWLAAMATIAWLVFRESVDRRLLVGAATILAGAVVLSWQGGRLGISWSAVLIAGACLAWGIDNNLTRKLSAADPVQIATVKGLAAGSVNLVLALGQGAALPDARVLLAAAAVGFLGYGVSLALFVLALRYLGTARTGAYFSTAPFVGAVAAVGLLGEPLGPRLVLAGALMAWGCGCNWRSGTSTSTSTRRRCMSTPMCTISTIATRTTPGDPLGEPHSHLHCHQTLRHKHPH